MAQALASFEHDHTEARLGREWLRQTDRSAGIELRNPPEQFSDLDAFELKYLPFREELLPQEQQYTSVDAVEVQQVRATYDADYTLSARAFDLQGAETKPMQHIVFRDVQLATQEFGTITGVADIHFDHVQAAAIHSNHSENDTYDQR